MNQMCFKNLVAIIFFFNGFCTDFVTSYNLSSQHQPTSHLPQDVALKAVSSLCFNMPNMPGCSIAKWCGPKDDHHVADKTFLGHKQVTEILHLEPVGSYETTVPSYCNPVSVLGDICAEDMPTMKTCREKYTCYVNQTKPSFNFFSNSSIECFDYPPLVYLPTTRQLRTNIKSICEEMEMDACENCNASSSSCDLFQTYSKLCLNMPNMHQCNDFQNFCSANPTVYACQNPALGGQVPSMKMYFHTGVSEYILFESFVPQSILEYTLACFLLFLLAVVYEILLFWLKSMEKKIWVISLRRRQGRIQLPSSSPELSKDDHSSSNDHHDGLSHQTSSPSNNLLFSQQVEDCVYQSSDIVHYFRGFVKILTSSIGYSLMLITMTFNVGLFLSVVFGLGVGTFATGKWFSKQHEANSFDDDDGLCC